MNYDPDLMPEELKEDKQITRAIDVIDLIIWGAFVGLGYLTRALVAKALVIPYMAGLFLIAFVLTRKSGQWNPKKKLYDSIRFMLMRPTDTFESEVVEEPVLDVEYIIPQEWEIAEDEQEEQ